MIGLYEDVSPPAGWYLCDGTNGTPDLQNRFIKLVASGSDGVGSGDGTVTAAGTFSHGTHTHKSTTFRTNSPINRSHDTYTQGDHSLNENYAWLPPYYALAFIMFGG